MRWTVTRGDILDQPTDVLVCSANVFLNLSGGVGGAILLRVGEGMQQELHKFLRTSGRRFVERGEVVVTGADGLAFRAVVHAVAVNGFYETSAEVVGELVATALRTAAGLGAGRVAMAALGTGYGRLPMAEFARGVRGVMGVAMPPVEEVVICVRGEGDRIIVAEELGLVA